MKSALSLRPDDDTAPESSEAPLSGASAFERREQERRARRLAELSQIAESRDQHGSLRAYYASQVEALLRTLILPSSRVLDVGCGLGDLLAHVAPANSIGIDVSAEMIERGRRRYPQLD